MLEVLETTFFVVDVVIRKRKRDLISLSVAGKPSHSIIVGRDWINTSEFVPSTHHNRLSSE